MGVEGAHRASNGFTLIELSIVLVIIGLIVGGIMMGQSLIIAAGARAQITQIEKYNTAANTFREKYGYLPGDIPNPYAPAFGFASRGTGPGQGDGNGILQGNNCENSNPCNYGWAQGAGETVMFWVDLSAAHLIDGGFSTGKTVTLPGSTISGAQISLYFPAAKIGNGNFIYAYSLIGVCCSVNDSTNYYGLSAISEIPSSMDGCGWCIFSAPGLTVSAAQNIDAKIDDGLPQSGNVRATYLNAALTGSFGRAAWAAGGGAEGASAGSSQDYAPTTSATPGSANTCYDNSSAASGTPGVAGAVQHYSLEISNGSNVNCALSFKMQAGD